MAVNLGTIWAELGLRMDKFEKGLKTAEDGIKKTEAKFESFKKAGERLSGVGKGLTAGVTLPIIAIGAAAVAAAMQFESATATIRAGTGATGEDLVGLRKDFDSVFKQVPQNAQEVATAIADLNTRLGLTGEPLQRLTKQMLDLADLTGTQVAPLIASATRVFGDWSVATADQSNTLDLLFKVSQSTGIGIDQLSNKLVQFGAPLRQMGFDIAESAALMGKWEKEGVNAELVLGSLRIAIGHFARENIPMREGLDRTIRSIQELGPGAEASALAMEVFGARAGPDMAAAILEGRFEIDKLMKSIAESPETIAKADDATETFAEQLAVLRNNVTLAIEPIGIKLLGALENIMPQLVAVIERVAGLAEWFGNISPAAQMTILSIVGLVAALGPALIVLGSMLKSVGAVVVALGILKVALLGSAATAGGAAAKKGLLTIALTKLKIALLKVKGVLTLATLKVVAIIAVVVGFAAAAALVIKNWDRVVPFLSSMWDLLTKRFSSSVALINVALQRMVLAIARTLESTAGSVARFLSGLMGTMAKVPGIGGAFKVAQRGIDSFSNGLKSMVDRAETNLTRAQNAARTSARATDTAFQTMTAAAKGVGEGMTESIGKAVESVKKYFHGFPPMIRQTQPEIDDAMADLNRTMTNAMVEQMSMMYSVGQDVGKNIEKGMEGTKDEIENAGEDLGKAAGEGFKKGAEDLVAQAQDAFDKAKDVAMRHLNRLNDKVIAALRRRYEAQRRLSEESLRQEFDMLERQRDAQLTAINAVYRATVAMLDAETQGKISSVQAQIDAIDNQIEAEERARRDKREQDRIQALILRHEVEEDAEKREEILIELNEAIAERNERLRREEIAAQRNALVQQISDIRQASELRKEQLEEDLQIQKAHLNSEYEAFKTSLEQRKESLDAFYDERLERASLQAEAEKLIMGQNQEEIIELLNSYGNMYEDSGKTLGERFFGGFKTWADQVAGLIANVQGSIAAANAAAARLTAAQGVVAQRPAIEQRSASELTRALHADIARVSALRGDTQAEAYFQRVWGGMDAYLASQHRRLEDASRQVAAGITQGFKTGLGISSPSYIERMMFKIVDASRLTLRKLQDDFSALNRLQVRPQFSTSISRQEPDLSSIIQQALAQLQMSRPEQRENTTSKQEVILEIDGVRLGRVILPNLIREEQRIGVSALHFERG